MRTLAHVLRHDLVLQARSFLYPATALSTAMICAFIRLLPRRPPSAEVLAFFVFMDPATVGLGFVGAIVLIEKSQGTLAALGVTPLPARTYVASKAASLTLVTLASSVVVVTVGTGWAFDVVRLLLALALSSTVAVLIGLLCVAGARSMNHLLMRLMWVTTLLYAPLLAHFHLAHGAVAGALAPIPSRAMLLALKVSLAPDQASPGEQAFALGSLVLWVAVLRAWTVRGFERAILTEGR